MTCSKVIDKLSFYVDGALDEQTLEMVEAHLSGCPGCRRELASLRLLVTAAVEIEPVQPPASLKYRIFEAVREVRAQERRCAQVSGLLSAYADGELTTKQAGLVEAHISFCDRCAQELRALRMIAGAAGTVAPVDPPAGLRTRIADAIADRSGESFIGNVLRGLRTTLQPTAFRLAAGGVAAAALVFTVVISMPRVPKQTSDTQVARDSAAVVSTTRVAITPNPAPSLRVSNAEPRVIRAAYRPATRIEKRHSPRPRVMLAAAFGAAKPALPRFKPAAKSGVPAVAITSPADEDTKASVEVKPIETAAAPAPAPVTKPEVGKPDLPALVKVASAPALAMDKAQVMMKQIKIEAAMRRSEARSTTVAIFSSRF